MNYITNEAVFGFVYRTVDRRGGCYGYVVANTWDRAMAIATAYCVEKAAHLMGVELLRDTQEASVANNAIVLIDKDSL